MAPRPTQIHCLLMYLSRLSVSRVFSLRAPSLACPGTQLPSREACRPHIHPFLSGPALRLPWWLLLHCNNFWPTSLILLFLGTMFLGVCFVRAILQHQKYLGHKLLATLLNRSARVGATSCTLALDWLESLVPHADLIASKQRSFSLWRLNSSDLFQKSKFNILNFQIHVNFLLFFVHYWYIICWGIAGCKYQEGNVGRGEGFWSKCK